MVNVKPEPQFIINDEASARITGNKTDFNNQESQTMVPNQRLQLPEEELRGYLPNPNLSIYEILILSSMIFAKTIDTQTKQRIAYISIPFVSYYLHGHPCLFRLAN